MKSWIWMKSGKKLRMLLRIPMVIFQLPIMSYIKISDEDINSIKQVLQQAGIKKISQLKPPPPPPPAKIEISLKKDGKVLFGKEEYSIAAIEQKIVTIQKEQAEIYKMYNMEPELVTSVKIEIGVTDAQVYALKEALRRSKALHVNYSTESKEQSSIEQSEEVKPPPPPMLWVEISKNKIILSNKEISLSVLEKETKSFIGKVKNQYLVRVSAEFDVSKEEIETVTEVLKRSNVPASKILCIVDDKPGN